MKTSTCGPGGFALVLTAIVGLAGLALGALYFLGGDQYSWALYTLIAVLAATPALAMSSVTWTVEKETLSVKQYFFTKSLRLADIQEVSIEENLGFFQGFGYNTDGTGATMLSGGGARATVRAAGTTLTFSVSNPQLLRAALES